MDTFKIKAVIAAIEQGSLSRAAEQFSYTPSAFSHMLSSFEDELGVRIFRRSSRGVTLTEEGKKLYPDFVRMAKAEQALLCNARQMLENQKFSLRIATYSSILRSFLSGMIKRFSEAHPNIELYITVADNLTGWLERDLADIVFADGRILEGDEWTPLMEDRCLAIAPPEFFKGRTSVERDELYESPFIFMDEEYVDGYFDKEKFKKVVNCHSDDDLSVIHMVKQGFGFTVLPQLVLQGNTDGVSVLSLSPPLKRTIGFAYNKHSDSIFPALAQFIRFLKEQAAQMQI